MAPAMLMQKIKKLEQKMYQHARNLEFEEAAPIRDEIERLRKFIPGAPDSKAG